MIRAKLESLPATEFWKAVTQSLHMLAGYLDQLQPCQGT